MFLLFFADRLKLGMQEIFDLYIKYLGLFFDTMWLWMPFVLSVAFFASWMYYIRRLYWRNLEWIILEVKPPKEIDKTPKNMEQIFAGLWGSFGTVGTKYQKYIQGFLQDYFSFEIVGIGGEIHFYLRTLKKYRNLVEAQVYSQYPHAEIKEVEDYITKIPYDVPSAKWDLWGCQFKLAAGNFLPIRTYPDLLDENKTDEPFLDPLASLMEIMGKLNPGEQIWIQLLFRPTVDTWRTDAINRTNVLAGKKPPTPKENFIQFETRTWGQAILGVLSELITGKAPMELKKENTLPSGVQFLTSGEKDIIKGIEEKAAKKGYESKLQWAYIGRKDAWSMVNVPAVMGIFNQFANLNLNSLIPDGKTITKANYGFAQMRKAFKQRILLKKLRGRTFWENGFILNIEELATVYHFPTIGIKAPMTPFIEVKKGSPPTDLPLG